MKSLKEFIENTDKRLAIIEEYLINDFKKKNKFKFTENEIRNLPMNIIFDEHDLNICPMCKTHVFTDDKYCKECGQRLVMEVNEC